MAYLFAATHAAADNAPAPVAANYFRTILADSAAGDGIVGVAAVVIRNGEIEFIATHGLRDLDGADPINEHTVFRIASLSKGMAAGLVSQLVAEGKANLTENVIAFAPELRLMRGAESLTLEHALSHRTSLPPYAYDNLLEAGIAPSEILQRYGDVKPICNVGDCYAYQNVIFDIATRLIEARDEKPYKTAIRERLFQPLGMIRASTSRDALQADENWARPHRRRRGQPWRSATVKAPYYEVPAAGGVNASILDMAAWLKAQMGHAPDVFSKEMLDLIHAPRIDTPGEVYRIRGHMPNTRAAQYGLGWRIYDYAGERVIAHFGSVDRGYSARIAFLPDRDVGIVLLTNSPSKEFARLLPAFLDQELNLSPDG